jgi:hypothetical protein
MDFNDPIVGLDAVVASGLVVVNGAGGRCLSNGSRARAYSAAFPVPITTTMYGAC